MADFLGVLNSSTREGVSAATAEVWGASRLGVCALRLTDGERRGDPGGAELTSAILAVLADFAMRTELLLSGGLAA